MVASLSLRLRVFGSVENSLYFSLMQGIQASQLLPEDGEANERLHSASAQHHEGEQPADGGRTDARRHLPGFAIRVRPVARRCRLAWSSSRIVSQRS